MNNIIRFAPATLTLAILSTLYQSAHAAEDPLADGETMVVQATAEEALKRQAVVVTTVRSTSAVWGQRTR